MQPCNISSMATRIASSLTAGTTRMEVWMKCSSAGLGQQGVCWHLFQLSRLEQSFDASIGPARTSPHMLGEWVFAFTQSVNEIFVQDALYFITVFVAKNHMAIRSVAYMFHKC